jgi:hypothetical protein
MMILFQIYFEVADDKREAFERAYAEVFAPALGRQAGFGGARLMRVFPASVIAEIEGEPTSYNYQVNFVFASEEARRKWVASVDHDVAWPKISVLAKKATWRGYDLLSGP